MNAILKHHEYSNRYEFARLSGRAFAGVAVLPNVDVMNACLRAGGKSRRSIEVRVVDNREGCWTAYQVDHEWSDVILLDADDGTSQILDLNEFDTDDPSLAISASLAAVGAR